MTRGILEILRDHYRNGVLSESEMQSILRVVTAIFIILAMIPITMMPDDWMAYVFAAPLFGFALLPSIVTTQIGKVWMCSERYALQRSKQLTAELHEVAGAKPISTIRETWNTYRQALMASDMEIAARDWAKARKTQLESQYREEATSKQALEKQCADIDQELEEFEQMYADAKIAFVDAQYRENLISKETRDWHLDILRPERDPS